MIVSLAHNILEKLDRSIGTDVAFDHLNLM